MAPEKIKAKVKQVKKWVVNNMNTVETQTSTWDLGFKIGNLGSR